MTPAGPPVPEELPRIPSRHRPLGLLAELTYRCPLHCPYCSNPTQYPRTSEELSTEEWGRVLQEAAGLGVLHALFSGGEPLVRGDLEILVQSARTAGLYTNLITSAVGLTPDRLLRLKEAGLDSVQISLQSSRADSGDAIAGARVHEKKLEAARWVGSSGLPLTINVVLHRGNLPLLEEIIALAETLGAERLELAHTQYYGWAFRNQRRLLPTREQVEEAGRIADAAKIRLRGKMEILYVVPDYFGIRPKPCMNGWGRRYLTVNSVGRVLPCPTAGGIPGMRFDSVRSKSLGWIWENSEAFGRFRGSEWMPEPCRSCPEREIDFGGCRCQAALLAGDASQTDPACEFSPHRQKLMTILQQADPGESADDVPSYQFRANPGRDP
ncbi:MAG TPA: pyrroloquinoline quinone biosynthesis protein PqqE [Planctomycetota bacterium]|nr:pyrroloquinoline quinone biosynthesis protein PqqE [Planctomycetota bacterium]